MKDNTSIFEGSSIPRLIVKFAVPTVLSQIVTLIYNLADTYFVGQTNDPSQVAALTISFPLFMALTMVANLFGVGANSYMSRSLGMGKREEAQKASTFAFYAAVVGALVIMAVLSIFMTPILHGIGARTPEAFEATKDYLTWTVIYGGLPTALAMLLAHLVRAEGNTKQASIGMIMGGLLNVFLDYIFVSLMGMGAEGAAMATALSNVVSLVYLLTVIKKNKNTVITLNPAKLSISPYLVKQIITVGLPAASVIILGGAANIVLNSTMAAYGDTAIAAYGIVQKFGEFAIQITIGISQGIMPLLGYHYGAGHLDKVKEINKWAFGILGTYALLVLTVAEIFAQPMVMLFMTEPTTVAKAVAFARIWIICAPGMCFTNLFCSIFQALGKWVQSLSLTVIRQGFLLIPLILIYNKVFGEIGLICAQPTADTITLTIGFILYTKVIRKLMKGEHRHEMDDRI